MISINPAQAPYSTHADAFANLELARARSEARAAYFRRRVHHRGVYPYSDEPAALFRMLCRELRAPKCQKLSGLLASAGNVITRPDQEQEAVGEV